MKDYFTAIVVKKLSTNQVKGYKYRNIDPDPAKLARFERFAKTLAGNDGEVLHINYYDKKTGNFMWRQTLKT